MLYDISICATDTCPSARNRKTLRYVTEALWQVESEFGRDSFEAVKDFNKLVIGSARNKLFIGPRLTPESRAGYLAALLPVARRCKGSVYVAMVPHPDAWGSSPSEALLWRLADGAWQGVN